MHLLIRHSYFIKYNNLFEVGNLRIGEREKKVNILHFLLQGFEDFIDVEDDPEDYIPQHIQVTLPVEKHGEFHLD